LQQQRCTENGLVRMCVFEG